MEKIRKDERDETLQNESPLPETSLSHDLEAVRKAVRDRFGTRVSALKLGGSFARGEGCYWERQGRKVPGNNLNFFLITNEPVEAEELESAKREILENTYVESVVLRSYVERELARLPMTVETYDLKERGPVLDGKPETIENLSRFDARPFPLFEAERLLRDRLVTLFEAYPGEDDSLRSYYGSAKAAFAAVDSFLIRSQCYSSSYREKVRRFAELVEDSDLVEFVEYALEVKIEGQPPAGWSAFRFWCAAARIVLDGFIDLLRPPGVYRPDRLIQLLGSFHFSTTSWAQTARNLTRGFFHRNQRGQLERLFLALAVARDVDSRVIRLAPYARAAGLPAEATWEELVPLAVDRWYALERE